MSLSQNFDRSIFTQARKLRKSASTSCAENRVIRPPSLRQSSGPATQQESSEPGMGSVLNEPGSKAANSIPQGMKLRHSPHLQGKQLVIVNDLREDARSMDKCAPHEEIIQPSAKTTERLNRIVGRPLGRPTYQHHLRSQMDGVDVSMRPAKRSGMTTTFGGYKDRQSQKRQVYSTFSKVPEVSDDQTECSASVATVSDLDNLAAKSLRRGLPAYQLGRSQLSVLRREIKDMVGSNLDERDAMERKCAKDETGTTMSQQHSLEVRESIEGTNEEGQPPRSKATRQGGLTWCNGPVEELVNGLRCICL